MRSILIAFFSIFAIGAASAADLGNSVKDVTITVIETTTNPFGGLYAGVTVGAQSTDITFTNPEDSNDYISGLNADGFLVGGHIGYNICPGRVCFGIEAEGAFSDVSLHVSDYDDLLQMEDYIQLTGHIGARVNNATMIYVKAGYEWQDWTAGIPGSSRTDIAVTAAVLGGGIKTFVAPQLAIGLDVDYLLLDELDIDDASSGFNDAANKVLEDSDAWRVKLRATWYPGAAAPSLDSIRF